MAYSTDLSNKFSFKVKQATAESTNRTRTKTFGGIDVVISGDPDEITYDTVMKHVIDKGRDFVDIVNPLLFNEYDFDTAVAQSTPEYT